MTIGIVVVMVTIAVAAIVIVELFVVFKKTYDGFVNSSSHIGIRLTSDIKWQKQQQLNPNAKNIIYFKYLSSSLTIKLTSYNNGTSSELLSVSQKSCFNYCQIYVAIFIIM